MTLTPAQIADVARSAGLSGDALVEAVALALATSGGVTDWHYRLEPGPLVDERGVWGVDVTVWPGLADYPLDEPASNAAAAVALYKALGGSWDWSAVWRAGTARRFAEMAARAVTETPTITDEARPDPAAMLAAAYRRTMGT